MDKKKRVKEFITDLDIDYVYSARKPSPCSFLEVMKKYKKNETQVAIIGDQLMTDVKGGNNIGITTVLVKPVCSYDPFFTKINRLREKRMFKKLRKYNLFKGRFYDEKM